MLKLFYASQTSAMAPHILLQDCGLDFQLARVNLDQKTWANGDYNDINPKSYVPTLQVADDRYFSECAVILEYISTLVDNRYTYAYGTNNYWQERTWLNYIATELHKNFISPFRHGNWLPNTADSKQLVWQRVAPRLRYVEQHWQGPWLMGDTFTAADAYLFVMTNWLHRLDYPIEELPRLTKFDARMRQRPSVAAVLQVEGQPHSLTDSQ
ncbi:glutathione S-transferase family protein [Schleiferilactobacillus shenzhenensis]|uniref:Glutathione S-transferase n=1 Tax=Schleiferilactobacillus shenzhenensis LY-73 TaxID=1231336 RepID=U4TQY0_9LACO|nr:glutathione S-transferase family protein [Schleiferilactobacillus shenzhenensis]ERL65850.1 glutathione S-transferase [Schleiferilactobacillus shenzhenensis LY-73]